MFKSILATILFLCVSISASHSTALVGQDQETSTRRQAEQVKAVEDAGGRVYKISAADSSREVSFALSGKPVGDKEIQNLSAIEEVVWLNLAGTKITNEGLKSLKGLPLKKLHLERTQIGDDGLKHLSEFKDLVYLNLYDTQVTNAGLDHLKALKNLKNLYVWKSKVTQDGMVKLNESLPDLKIVGELKLAAVVVEEPKKEEVKKEETNKDAVKKEEAEKPADEAKANRKKRKKGKKKQDADKKANDK